MWDLASSFTHLNGHVWYKYDLVVIDRHLVNKSEGTVHLSLKQRLKFFQRHMSRLHRIKFALPHGLLAFARREEVCHTS